MQCVHSFCAGKSRLSVPVESDLINKLELVFRKRNSGVANNAAGDQLDFT